jgi:hypothetical protein
MAGHQHQNVADLAGPAALHDNAVEIEMRVLALGPQVSAFVTFPRRRADPLFGEALRVSFVHPASHLAE